MSTELKLVNRMHPDSPGLAEVARQIGIERRMLLLGVKAALDCDDYATAKSLMGELVNDESKGYRIDPREHASARRQHPNSAGDQSGDGEAA